MSWGKTKEIGRGRIVGTYRIGIRQEWIVNAMCSSRYKSKYKKLLYCRYGKRSLIVSSLLKEKHEWSLVSLWSLRFSLGLCLKGPMQRAYAWNVNSLSISPVQQLFYISKNRIYWIIGYSLPLEPYRKALLRNVRYALL